MSSLNSAGRNPEAAQRSIERDALKRQREFERRLKEQAKLSALEQARLEVEAHENTLEVLLSVYKEQSAPFDWRSLASSLPPYDAPRLARHELAALLNDAVSVNSEGNEAGEAAIAEARKQDDREHEILRARFEADSINSARLRSLAQRVLVGEPRAYVEAVSDCSALAEISNLGSSIAMTVHGSDLVECVLNVNGRDIIPSETKALTTDGKLSVKTMPKAQFHEIYQDYVCGCVLRLGREVLALLPIKTVLVTATVNGIDSRTGHAGELPVLSVAIPRSVCDGLDFERLAPSDSLDNFLHRGDVKASRKSGEFVPIVPLTHADLASTHPETTAFSTLVDCVRLARAEIGVVQKLKTSQSDESLNSAL